MSFLSVSVDLSASVVDFSKAFHHRDTEVAQRQREQLQDYGRGRTVT